MKESLKTAAIGAGAGAVAALAVGLIANVLGVFPAATDARLHAYLMAHPAIVYDMAAQAQLDDAIKEKAARQKAVDKLGTKAFFDPAIAFVTGPANAKNTVVEFFDYNCVHCRNSFAAVKAFYDAHKADTRFAFIELPVNGEASTIAATAAVAARAQGDKYLALHFALMGEKAAIDPNLLLADAKKVGIDTDAISKAMTDPKVEKALKAGRKLAADIGVNGTPTFIVNGKVHDGEIGPDDFKKLTK